MHGAIFGEFLGTMVLLLFGNGVVANVVLDRSKGKDGGWMVIATGWGFAVFCGIVTSLAVGGVGVPGMGTGLEVRVLCGVSW